MSASYLDAVSRRSSDAKDEAAPGGRLLILTDDSLAFLAAALDADSMFSFSLTCRRLNEARGEAELKTSIVSTVQSPSLRSWAHALGCPTPYPHWAELKELKKDEWNGRLIRVEGEANCNGRQPVHVDAHIARQRPLLLAAHHGDTSRWPGEHALIHRDNIAPLGASEVARMNVLVLDTMLPRQKLRVTREENERLLMHLVDFMNRHRHVDDVASFRVGMVGRMPRSQHELLPATAPPPPLPFGVEVHLAAHVETKPASDGFVRAVTVTAGRPFELLEILKLSSDGSEALRVATERDPHTLWQALSGSGGHAASFLARVRWRRLQSPPASVSSQEKLAGLIRARFRHWGALVRRHGHERFPRQLDQVLADLGPCPSIDEPDAACLWLAALLNPLPALGVAPEIRGHVLSGGTWVERLSPLQKALDASLQVVQVPSRRPASAAESDDEQEEIDVCRVS